jgi:adenylate kinase
LLRGKDSGRADDANPEVIQNRINIYNRDTAPLKNFYKEQGKYRGVEGFGTIEDIFDRICNEIDLLK